MCDCFVFLGIPTPGEEKEKKLMEDPPPVKSTWQVGECSRCNRWHRAILPRPPIFTFSWSEVCQPPIDPSPLAKRRKIKKTWKRGSRFYLDMKAPRPKARRKQALPSLLPPSPPPQSIENENPEENSTDTEIDEEPTKEEDSSSEYDPDATTTTYEYRNPDEDAVELEWGD
jgi:hypothetical protein